MSSQDPTIFLVLIFVAIGAAVALAAWQISRRRAAARVEALKRQAMLMGYSFRQEALKLDKDEFSGLDPRLAESLKSMQLFQKGRRQRLSNLMSKDEDSDRRAWIFDFQYETGAGNNRQRIRQTVFGCHQGKWSIPGFTLQKEGLFSRLFDGADIDFEQDAAFSKQYLLKGNDGTSIKRLFTPSVRSFLLEQRDWTVEASGSRVFACRKGKLSKTDDLMTALNDFNRFLNLLAAELER
jgi:hypothetical protein